MNCNRFPEILAMKNGLFIILSDKKKENLSLWQKCTRQESLMQIFVYKMYKSNVVHTLLNWTCDRWGLTSLAYDATKIYYDSIVMNEHWLRSSILFWLSAYKRFVLSACVLAILSLCLINVSWNVCFHIHSVLCPRTVLLGIDQLYWSLASPRDNTADLDPIQLY